MEQSKQLSPMEQLIEYLKKQPASRMHDSDYKRGMEYAYDDAIDKATELLTSSSKVVTTEEVYRWVKASERLPEKYGDYNAKYEDESCVILFTGDGEVRKIRFANGGVYTAGMFNITSLYWLEKITT